MARGWESKSVEAQIDMIESDRQTVRIQSKPDPEVLVAVRQKEHILLSRTRIARELTAAQNPRYKAVLNKALADLDAKLLTMAAAH
jgi:hypothetical protein